MLVRTNIVFYSTIFYYILRTVVHTKIVFYSSMYRIHIRVFWCNIHICNRYPHDVMYTLWNLCNYLDTKHTKIWQSVTKQYGLGNIITYTMHAHIDQSKKKIRMTHSILLLVMWNKYIHMYICMNEWKKQLSDGDRSQASCISGDSLILWAMIAIKLHCHNKHYLCGSFMICVTETWKWEI